MLVSFVDGSGQHAGGDGLDGSVLRAVGRRRQHALEPHRCIRPRAAVPTPVVAVLLRIISASFGTAANRLTACLPDPPVKEWVSVTEYLLLGQLRAL